jgi:hypothetical protein
MHTVSSFAIAAGLAVAVASPAFAQTADTAQLERRSRTDLRVERAPLDTGVAERGTQFPPGSIVTMRDELENFPLDTSFGGGGVSAPPTSFTGPPGFVWPNNNLRGQGSINFVRLVDLSGAPVSGPNGVTNGTKALRIFTANAQPGNGFYTGANIRFGGGLPDGLTQPIAPIPGVNARVSSEHWVSSINTLYSFEPAAVFAGAFTGRMLWGGDCIELAPGDCTGVGLPVGILDYFLVFAPNASFENWVPARYCENSNGVPIPGCVPPAGFNIGDIARPPIQNWFRLAAETSADGHFRISVDHLDGSGEAAILDTVLLTTSLMDRLGWNASFEAQGEFMLIDNIEASGALYVPPTPPELICPYLDDIEWLNPGPLFTQTSRWFAALSSAALVVDETGNRFLRQTNSVSSDNEFREEIRTTFPASFALPADPWSLCLDAATTLGSLGHPTARAFAIDSEATNYVPGGVTARVYLGITDPVTGIADSTIYVQTNIDYDPIDDPFGLNPLEFQPAVGVDVVSTGVQWPADGQFRTLCITVANDNAMTVSLEGVEIYSGTAFSNGANTLRVESENTATGEGGRLDLDNIEFDCDALPLVSLPALTTPYLDDFGWGVDNIPPNRHIDDPTISPFSSTRYTNANGVVALDAAIAMRNVFTDTTHSAPPNPNGPNGFIFTQFSTDTPSIAVSTQVGWRVEMTLILSDFLTSRGFSPAQLADVGGVLEIDGYLWISAVDQKVYLFGAPENAQPDHDLFVVDTGFTLDALGVTPNTPFTASAEYNREAGLIDWSLNNIALGSTFPIVGTDDLDLPRIHRNLDAVFMFGGDDDTAPATPPFSTMTLDDLRITKFMPCPADANGDNIVNFADLNAVLSSFGATGAPGSLPADFNADGVVNFADLNAVLADFGATCV